MRKDYYYPTKSCFAYSPKDKERNKYLLVFDMIGMSMLVACAVFFVIVMIASPVIVHEPNAFIKASEVAAGVFTIIYTFTVIYRLGKAYRVTKFVGEHPKYLMRL